jgi:Flp pilus assembly protein TadG
MIRLPAFLRDRRGATAVEFAFVAPVLITLVCGTVEFGHFYMEQTSLDGALLEAARTASASQEQSETTRDTAMRTSVTNAMSQYKTATGKALAIATTVYADFSSAQPEPFVDTNKNGVYDPASGNNAAEPFTDRNGNGKWDAAIPQSGTEGDPGDVVSYTATYPAAFLFPWLGTLVGRTSLTLTSTVVTRNEPVKTS